jgi:hypothetical protein
MPHRTYKGRNTIRLAEFTPAWLDNPDLPENTRKRTRVAAALWLLAGCLLMLLDGLALVHFCATLLEAFVFAGLTLPTGIFIICAAVEARK